jgi:Ca2+-transporting ATPase
MSSDPTIELLHHAAPGRVRVKIGTLYRNERVRQELERTIGHIRYVESVRANSLTCGVVILFDPTLIDVTQLLTEIGALAGLTWPSRPTKPTSASTTGHAPARLLPFLTRFWRTRPTDAPPTLKARRPRPDTRPPPEGSWCTIEPERALALLDSSRDGLLPPQVARHLALYGPNRIGENKPRSALSIFLQQFLSAPVAMLGVSALVSVATGGVADALAIGGVVIINAIIGYATESSAERTINALGRLAPTQARVLREGHELGIAAEEVTIGDILVLTPGAFVPADARLIASNSLTVDESALTGESLPVHKSHEAKCRADVPLGERISMVHMGTVVTGGNGLAVTTAIGRHTEIGRIQSLVGEVAPPDTPMQQQLDRLGLQLAAISGGICALVFGLGLLRGQGWLPMLGSSISLAVAAVPEGLPAVATTTLALGIHEMQRHRVLIRQLPAVESLGSIQTLCLDKTGTLTMNQMKVVALRTARQQVTLTDGAFYSEGERFEPLTDGEIARLLEVISLCSEVKLNGSGGSELQGTPTESALIEAAMLAGLDPESVRKNRPLAHIRHRAETRPYMLTAHRDGDRYFLAVKGSPAEVLGLCSERRTNGACVHLDESARNSILEHNADMASDALRVLGVAYGYSQTAEPETAEGLIWLGLIGMEDIIRPGTPELIGQLHDAGIETVMITGDQSATAFSVGKRLGLNRDRPLEIVDSVSLDRLPAEILTNLVKDTAVFARVSPAHKLRIVQAMQQAGRVVAMTGDGVNDGPALKAADVGVAMGKRGTDVARSVADVVLEDDNLETMIEAVRRGRTIYSNIRKSLRFLLSTNLSEIEVMLICTALGLGEALNPLQLLWINLMTDIFPALALALEPPERDVLKQPPRAPNEPIIGRLDYSRLLRESSVITAGAMGVFAFSLSRYGAGLRTSSNTFNTLVLNQFLHAWVCRSEDTTFLDRARPGNRYLNLALAASFGMQALAVALPPLRSILRLTPPTLADLALIAGGSTLPFLINESSKRLRLDTPERSERP